MVIYIVGTFLIAVSLNFFLIPANVFASGFTGIAQILAAMTPISTGISLFLLNIPVAILGWMKIGKKFTIFSFVNVALSTVFLEILPIVTISEDILLNSVFGGVIMSIGAGMILKYGSSTGGVDIIALVLARYSDRPLGTYFFIINAVIVLTAGLIFDWEKALYTLVTLYVGSRIIDAIHTRHVKLTAMIVTSKPEELQQAIHEQLTRGITRIPAKGGYTKEEKEMLMIVITRYELYNLKQIIAAVDDKAFTNIVETAGIYGLFRKED
ncbi:YitT family protein [Anaerobacillus alkaliphilus]|uniref:YitT family protein n=1 Tax=Anaerobacillus alkaliphilus TaxID=1548597 RepID=A0A4Q0VQM3_9BACI|nr:YitT family protein [Anaerobacillus alkaliphilus]RXI98743.1 YitT family protein [Anaerobacillus alkaliphilus]